MKSRLTLFVGYAKCHFQDTLYLNSYYLMASAAISAAASMLFWMVAARFYEAQSVGYASVLVSSLGLISVISNVGLGIGLIRYSHNAGIKKAEMLNTVLTLVAAASIIIAVSFVIGSSLFAPSLQHLLWKPHFLVSFIAFTLCWSLSYILSCLFLASCASRYSFLQSVMSGTLKVVFLVMFLFFIKDTYAIYSAAGLAMLISLLASFLFFVPRVCNGFRFRISVSQEVLRKIGHYSVANYVSRTSLEMSPLLLPIIALHFLGPERTAYFFIPWSIATAAAIIPTSIFNSMFAIGSAHPTALKTSVIKSTRLSFILTTAAILPIVMFSGEILMVFGPTYAEYGNGTLVWFSVALLPYGVNYFFVSVARVESRTTYLVSATTLLTVTCIGGAILLSTLVGDEGIAYGWVVGQTAVAALLAGHYSFHRSKCSCRSEGTIK